MPGCFGSFSFEVIFHPAQRMHLWHDKVIHMQSGDKQRAPLESHEPIELDELSMQCELDDQFEQLQRARQTLEFEATPIAPRPSDE